VGTAKRISLSLKRLVSRQIVLWMPCQTVLSRAVRMNFDERLEGAVVQALLGWRLRGAHI